MSNFLLPYRYSLFALFLVFNAIICSVAVWNYTIARSLLLTAKVDVYLAVIGGIGVLFIIPITFVDVFRKNALTSRVWFELAWVALFWVLELCGASAFTALLPDSLCSPLAVSLQRDSCTSSRVLEAFTWLCTVILLIYLVMLFISALLHSDDDSAIWHSSVRFYPWYATRSSLGSAPSSPTKAGSTWQRRSLKLAAPKPKRPIRPAELDLEAATNGPEMQMQQSARESVSVPEPVASMYPAHLASKIGAAAQASPATGATPPPLGDWPHSMRQQSQRQKRSRIPPPPSVPSPIAEATSPSTAPALSITTTATPRSAVAPRTAGPSRPTHGPRRGSGGSPTRRAPPPPPLDLTRISAYNAIEARRK